MSLVFYFLLFQITDLRCAVGLDAALYINTETALALQLGHFALQLFNLSKVNNKYFCLRSRPVDTVLVRPSIALLNEG